MFLYRVRIVADQEESDKVKTIKARKKLELIETTLPPLAEMIPKDLRGAMMEREWKKVSS